MVSLFTSETKTAMENCKLKARCISDPLPFEDMQDIIPPNPCSKHKLNEFLSK